MTKQLPNEWNYPVETITSQKFECPYCGNSIIITYNHGTCTNNLSEHCEHFNVFTKYYYDDEMEALKFYYKVNFTRQPWEVKDAEKKEAAS